MTTERWVILDLPLPLEPVCVDLNRPLEDQLHKGWTYEAAKSMYEELKDKPAVTMVLVPLEPTAEMRKAGFLRITVLNANVRVADIWQAMIEAWDKENPARKKDVAGL